MRDFVIELVDTLDTFGGHFNFFASHFGVSVIIINLGNRIVR